MALLSPRQKKGFVYTLCVLFLAAVLLELLAFNAEWAGHRRIDVQPPSDAEVLAYRADELSWLSREAMGLNASLSRNMTNLTLNISDMGFPLVNYTNGSIQITSLKAWLENNWTNVTDTNLSFNVTMVNSTGPDPVWNNYLLQTPDGINYSHASFYNDRDMANLTMPGNFSPANITVQFFCTHPANTSAITYTGWTSPGGGLTGTMSYTDPTAGTYANVSSWPPGSNNSFVANFTDASGLWLQAIHADWVASATNDSLLI
ncbi:MAG: hypothetical protein KGH63_02455, partial [Candidatus Micrarchaeota archaeon]|nr:hypothetical protein [Candidatus Micrarchaeota archaeon]